MFHILVQSQLKRPARARYREQGLTVFSNSKKASVARCIHLPSQSAVSFVIWGPSSGFQVGELMVIFLKPT